MFEVVVLEGFVWQPDLKNDFFENRHIEQRRSQV
jgi:hypothetical protein